MTNCFWSILRPVLYGPSVAAFLQNFFFIKLKKPSGLAIRGKESIDLINFAFDDLEPQGQ